VNVSRETHERLAAYAELLLRWNTRIRLIGGGHPAQVWSRHFEDSLQLSGLVPPTTHRAIDLGSGAGFPGLVLAIVTGIPFDLIESDHRKSAFLREAIRVTGAPAEVVTARIEDHRSAPVRLVTARALAPLPRLLALSERFLLPDGHALFPKGANAALELTEARKQWQMQVREVRSRTSGESTILDITGLRRVGLSP
jgi:16S rRNA (guanine527-N7)-methyltransferase